jgi:MFS family permease
VRSLLYGAAGARSFTTGLVGVLLGVYLAELGFGAAALGVIVGAGLAGNAVGTALVAAFGEPWGRRRVLLAAAALSAAGVVATALASSAAPLALAGFLGMVNGMGRDRGPAQTIEQSLLADATGDSDRTAVFVRYTFLQDVLGAFGSLAAAAPALLERLAGVPVIPAYRATLIGAAAVSLIPLSLYARLPADPMPAGAAAARPALSPASRRRVGGLAALFAVDSLGGGLLAGSILSYWFFRRFGLGPEALGPLFFAARALNALSYFAAEWLARRIGLLRTMVFTHLPSSLVLLALPFITAVAPAVVLFLVREALVQMDVPARQAYVAQVTAPGERTAALGITGLARNVGWALGPPLAGGAMTLWGLGAPLIWGAGLKAIYDVALYASYRNAPTVT